MKLKPLNIIRLDARDTQKTETMTDRFQAVMGGLQLINLLFRVIFGK